MLPTQQYAMCPLGTIADPMAYSPAFVEHMRQSGLDRFGRPLGGYCDSFGEQFWSGGPAVYAPFVVGAGAGAMVGRRMFGNHPVVGMLVGAVAGFFVGGFAPFVLCASR